MEFRFKPSFEWLEAREVPANFLWSPLNNDTDGGDAQNWLQGEVRGNGIPDDATDNMTFSTTNVACNFGAAQGSFLGTITVTSAYTSTIKLHAHSWFVGCSILGACTIDLNAKTCDFGGTAANPGVIGNQADSIRPNIIGGGTIAVGGTLRLSSVTLGSSVSVNNGGTLYFGYITFGNNADPTFTVNNGGTAQTEPNATYISAQVGNVYKQPITVLAGGSLNVPSSTTVVSYILCSGTVLVQGTQASPNVILTIAGSTTLSVALGVNPSGVLNLAAGSTISTNSGNVSVAGGMNLFGAPPGSTATTATITGGNLNLAGTSTAYAVLNLNNGTLRISNGNVAFSYAHVTTNVAYGDDNPPTGPVLMGNISVNGSVTFNNTNKLTQSATGTPRNFTLPLITCSTRTGDFSQYVTSDGDVKPWIPPGSPTLMLKRQV